ncbi:glucosamine-6-phosphate isomerase 1 [Sphaeroforma arctica JP610]|uniref:Glucosamine-6-phosphate isomerase n=1 Tax=Sphaeroforma arctica JP610 TaxID=667725 RepID=A0A0L0FJY0_9EUKA|nr:glucosamine-6-phosphate isomerase 1 [Sphaeroforma arctica JP610]KNC77072.1 glucosamine-6-phosphate isomerase 1 [Sphaeroforma arctica JP610]|eukprot:XP_014150974.1 glucosamine-6-phosphate isomerase 1 [Sphaeroforma arctica JP610]
MKLIIEPDAEHVATYAADYIKKRINAYGAGPDNYFVLGLPTGGTPVKTYKKLIEFVKAGELSFKYVKTFNMDEYVGLPEDHPQSYHTFMFDNFFKHIDINPANTHLLDGNAKDLTAECAAYEERILVEGGIELFLGGMGNDGHVAFNEPCSSLASRTRIKTLTSDTIVTNSRFFNNDVSKVPKMSLTVGVGTVFDARDVLLLVTGESKALALHHCVEKGSSHMWTASVFQHHVNSTIVCDEDATMELKVKTVKYFKDTREIIEKNFPGGQ